jgi:Rod binding domain-containing protein
MTFPALNTGLPTLTNRREVTSAGAQPETSAHKKLRKAAQEFEGILISQLLGESQMGLSSLSGDSPPAGSDTLNSLAIQTLSGAMAGRGGFGIGQMLVHQLEPGLNRGAAK